MKILYGKYHSWWIQKVCLETLAFSPSVCILKKKNVSYTCVSLIWSSEDTNVSKILSLPFRSHSQVKNQPTKRTNKQKQKKNLHSWLWRNYQHFCVKAGEKQPKCIEHLLSAKHKLGTLCIFSHLLLCLLCTTHCVRFRACGSYLLSELIKSIFKLFMLPWHLRKVSKISVKRFPN